MHTRFSAVVVPILIALVARHAMANPASPPSSPHVHDTESMTVVDHTVDAIIRRGPKVIYATYDEIIQWIADNDPDLLAAGPLGSDARVGPIPATPAANPNTTVMFCSNVSGENCEPPCTWYTGGPGCIRAPNTNCALATYDVEFCSAADCEPVCGETYADCGDFLANGFCHVPQTNSFLVLPH